MSECNHPKNRRKNWHDGAVLCDECGCIIEQFGKPIEPPAPLFDKPSASSPALALLAADDTLAALSKQMADEYQSDGQNWSRAWMQKHSEQRAIISKAREVLVDRAEAANDCAIVDFPSPKNELQIVADHHAQEIWICQSTLLKDVPKKGRLNVSYKIIQELIKGAFVHGSLAEKINPRSNEQASSSSVDQKRLVLLLKGAAYNLWRACLCAGPPSIRELFEELRKPQVGDLVMETSTHRMESRDPVEGIGTLIKFDREPIYATREEAAEAGYEEGEEVPTRKVWTITLDFDDGREYRWTNADFIKVKTDN